jgi:sarcosine oxidase
MSAVAKSWDVIVVGLGAMGAATLYQLAKRGVRVLGIDRFHPPHDLGSSHGDTRITRLALGEGAHYLPLARRSHEIWRELEAATGEVLFRQTGGLVFSSLQGREVAHGAADFLQTTIDVAREHGIAHEVLNATAMAGRFPQFRFAGDEMGCFEPSAGLVHPERCIAAQLTMAQRLGAGICTGEQVTRWAVDGASVRIETSQGQFFAERVIFTTGSWIAELLPELAATTKVCRQVLYWFEPDGNPEVFSDAQMPVYIRVPDARAAMFYGFPGIDGAGGGVKLATEQFDVACVADAIERSVSEAEAQAMHALASPHVRITSRLVRAAVCQYTVTPDFHFVIDQAAATDRVWLASACSGHGFKHSAGVGEALSQQIVDGRSDADLEPFACRA